MLLHLSVENFILIQDLELDFHAGFTAITGETGAGKSILVGALGLILGQRADTQALMDKTRKCIVEGSFSLEGYGLETLFEDADLDYENVTTLRREITPQGKSRAFINDTPVNLSILKELGDRLVDIHSQNQTLELNESAFQMAMLDSYSGNGTELLNYAIDFLRFRTLRKELGDAVEMEAKALLDREYYEFQLEEFNKANLSENEQEELEQELELLNHAEEIKTKLMSALHLLEESDPGILSGLAESRQVVDQASRYSNHLESIAQRLESSYIELKEIAHELRGMSEHIHYDPERIQTLSQRLDHIYHLQQKHKLSSIRDLLNYRDEIQSKLEKIDTLADRISQLSQEVAEVEDRLGEWCVLLTEKRKTAIPGIEKEMESVLADLGMVSARFRIILDPLELFTKDGKDKVTFLFTANRGGELREIQKVASGGELSRLMLALKSLVVKRSMLPTILFDEIDSGVSGEIAGKIGAILRSMSQRMQVIAITHLPQIAGKADQHLLAFKQEHAQSTYSNLRELNPEERINEIARMLSDDIITDTARAAAKELIIS